MVTDEILMKRFDDASDALDSASFISFDESKICHRCALSRDYGSGEKLEDNCVGICFWQLLADEEKLIERIDLQGGLVPPADCPKGLE